MEGVYGIVQDKDDNFLRPLISSRLVGVGRTLQVKNKGGIRKINLLIPPILTRNRLFMDRRLRSLFTHSNLDGFLKEYREDTVHSKYTVTVVVQARLRICPINNNFRPHRVFSMKRSTLRFSNSGVLVRRL